MNLLPVGRRISIDIIVAKMNINVIKVVIGGKYINLNKITKI